ncbi:Oligopeptide transport ATP-binding protein AppF [Hyphomicrobiales bacterium]|nr:Oligopeptide transport ATP-binding protein AppF [Hyphomicrobiales bacterium]CAH1694526.1 Oligopeptide transport ATP-binding protein AppF [Hyphomicrobiales bacterium]
MAEPILSVHDLQQHFHRRKGFLKRETTTVRAVDGISFDLIEGETLGLVGESGCGKSTTGRALVGAYRPTAGSARYRRADGQTVDLVQADPAARRAMFSEIRLVFQDPQSSLNPRMRVIDIVGEPLRNFGLARGADLRERVGQLLAQVGLRPEYIDRYPHAFSGGERQRIGIARAIATRPRLLVADEAVSALDVSIRAQILNLLVELQSSLGLTYLFISHDMSVVRRIASRVAVMYVGRIVEIAQTADIFRQPLHPYSRALLSAVPDVHRPKSAHARRIRLAGEVADPANPPSGCHFHPRCPFASDRCRTEAPALRRIAGSGEVACHHAEEIAATSPAIPFAQPAISQEGTKLWTTV